MSVLILHRPCHEIFPARIVRAQIQDLKVSAHGLKIWSQCKINSAIHFVYVFCFFQNIKITTACIYHVSGSIIDFDFYFEVLLYFLKLQLDNTFCGNTWFSFFSQNLFGFVNFSLLYCLINNFLSIDEK